MTRQKDAPNCWACGFPLDFSFHRKRPPVVCALRRIGKGIGMFILAILVAALMGGFVVTACGGLLIGYPNEWWRWTITGVVYVCVFGCLIWDLGSHR